MDKQDYIQKKAQQCRRNFLDGYNCAQSVLLAFTRETGFSTHTAAMLASSFGAGMGKLRQVCGAASAMFMVCGLCMGYDDPTDPATKAAHYARIQDLAARFTAANGALLCSQLLKDVENTGGSDPAPRTPAYYAARPCPDIIFRAGEILAQYLWENGVVK